MSQDGERGRSRSLSFAVDDGLRHRTGEKYRRENCRYLAQSSIPIPLESAAGRLEPCSVCRPPRM